MILETPKYIIDAFYDSGIITIKQAYGCDRDPVRLEVDDIDLLVAALLHAKREIDANKN